MRILIAYDSLSGNTRDLARMVRGCCEARGHDVTWSCPVREFGHSVNTVGAASVLSPSSLEWAA